MKATTPTRRILSLALLMLLTLQLILSAAPAMAQPQPAAPVASSIVGDVAGQSACKGESRMETIERNANGSFTFIRYLSSCDVAVQAQRLRNAAIQINYCTIGASTLGTVVSVLLGVEGFLLPAGLVFVSSSSIAGGCAGLANAYNHVAGKLDEANKMCGDVGLWYLVRVEPGSTPKAYVRDTGYGCQTSAGTKGASVPTTPDVLAFNELSVDYAFVVDTTGSMGSSIQSVKSSLTQILGAISDTGANWRVAVVEFRDHGDVFVSRVDLGFSADKTAITSAINALGADGGGDTPEAVYSGLMTAIRLPWRDGAQRQIILMGDAPPKDPEPNTGYTQNSVVSAANAGGIAATNRAGLAKPAAGLGTPININTILVGGDTATRTAFQSLADRTGGKLFSGDVVKAFLDAIALVVFPAPKLANMVLNKPATNYIQSNDQPLRVASLAVDGNTNGSAAANTMSMTHFYNEASWTVDLGASRWIDELKVWKRTDCCMSSMSDYYIFVSDKPFTANSVSSSLTQPGVTNIFRAGWSTTPTDTFSIGRTGRYVRIQLKGANVLSLAEVQLMGAQ